MGFTEVFPKQFQHQFILCLVETFAAIWMAWNVWIDDRPKGDCLLSTLTALAI